MTAWSLEHMGIAIYCLSYIENLRQAFTAATLSCCLFVALYALSFVFSYWKAYSVGLRSGDSRGHQRISNFLPLRNYSGSFAVCVALLSICTGHCVAYTFIKVFDCMCTSWRVFLIWLYEKWWVISHNHRNNSVIMNFGCSWAFISISSY